MANIRERALNWVGPSLMDVPRTQAYDSVCHPDIDERRLVIVVGFKTHAGYGYGYHGYGYGS